MPEALVSKPVTATPSGDLQAFVVVAACADVKTSVLVAVAAMDGVMTFVGDSDNPTNYRILFVGGFEEHFRPSMIPPQLSKLDCADLGIMCVNVVHAEPLERRRSVMSTHRLALAVLGLRDTICVEPLKVDLSVFKDISDRLLLKTEPESAATGHSYPPPRGRFPKAPKKITSTRARPA